MDRIYLDFNASTPICPEAAAAMRPFLGSDYGNPSSPHWAGRPAHEAVEAARGQVAALLACRPEEIVFTSGGSEANNHAIKGVFYRRFKETPSLRPSDLHFVTSAVEHPAVLEPLRFLESLGVAVTIVPVDRTGRVEPREVGRALRPETVLVSVMHANNEVGTIQPIAEIAAIVRPRGILFHTDAAQSIGKIPADPGTLGVDLLSVAGHKLYAPKGVGALYVRNGVRLEPLVHGAGHERGRRAGTENVLLDVGLGAACAAASSSIGIPRVRALRDRFEGELLARYPSLVSVNGHPEFRLPNTLNVNFAGHAGADILDRLEGVAASTGSACHAGSIRLSPVLEAMGVPPETGMGAVRFSLGRSTTEAEIEQVLEKLDRLLPRG